jgi:hypothetical protein
MVSTHNGRADVEDAQPNGAPPPPPTLAQDNASILELRDEQIELLCQLMNNSTRGGNGVRNAQGQVPTTYGEFLATHRLTFSEAGEPLEANHWLCTIEYKFGLIHCTEYQKTLFAASAATTECWRMVG